MDVRQSERRFARSRPAEATLDHLPVAVSVIRAADGELLYVNDAWQAMFGFRRDEAVGRHVSLIAAHALASVRATEMQRELERTGRWQGEVEARRKDGETVWATTDVCQFHDPVHGSVLIDVQRDVTAEREAHAVRAQAAHRWSSAFEDAPVGMAVIAPDLRMVDVNERLCAMSGYPRRELIGTSLATLAISLRQGRTTETVSLTAVRLSVGTLPKPVSVKLTDRALHREGRDLLDVGSRRLTSRSSDASAFSSA